MKMPNPIAIRFAKLIFSILSITVLGVIFAMISHDHKLLILSAGVSITGGVKACSFYRQVSRQQYERLNGIPFVPQKLRNFPAILEHRKIQTNPL